MIRMPIRIARYISSSRPLSLLFIPILAMLSSAPAGAARGQSVAVPLPPAAKIPAAKAGHAGLPAIPKFKDVARELGLTVPHISTGDKQYIVESISGGVGLFDCDDDGRLDIVTVNGSTVERYKKGGDLMVTLYHQEADGTFKDITGRWAHAAWLGNGSGCRGLRQRR